MTRDCSENTWINKYEINLERKNGTRMGSRNEHSQTIYGLINPKLKFKLLPDVGICPATDTNMILSTILISVYNGKVTYCLLDKTKYLCSKSKKNNIVSLRITLLAKPSSGNTVLNFEKSEILSIDNTLVFLLHKEDFPSEIEYMTVSPFVFTTSGDKDNTRTPSPMKINMNACFDFYKRNYEKPFFYYESFECGDQIVDYGNCSNNNNNNNSPRRNTCGGANTGGGANTYKKPLPPENLVASTPVNNQHFGNQQFTNQQRFTNQPFGNQHTIHNQQPSFNTQWYVNPQQFTVPNNEQLCDVILDTNSFDVFPNITLDDEQSHQVTKVVEKAIPQSPSPFLSTTPFSPMPFFSGPFDSMQIEGTQNSGFTMPQQQFYPHYSPSPYYPPPPPQQQTNSPMNCEKSIDVETLIKCLMTDVEDDKMALHSPRETRVAREIKSILNRKKKSDGFMDPVAIKKMQRVMKRFDTP